MTNRQMTWDELAIQNTQLKQRAEAAEQQLAIANGTSEILGEQAVTSECCAAGLRAKLLEAEQRAEQLQRERDLLAACAVPLWKAYTSEFGLHGIETCKRHFCDTNNVSRETFDRLIGGGKEAKHE